MYWPISEVLLQISPLKKVSCFHEKLKKELKMKHCMGHEELPGRVDCVIREGNETIDEHQDSKDGRKDQHLVVESKPGKVEAHLKIFFCRAVVSEVEFEVATYPNKKVCMINGILIF
jgi:hypothetical protein